MTAMCLVPSMAGQSEKSECVQTVSAAARGSPASMTPRLAPVRTRISFAIYQDPSTGVGLQGIENEVMETYRLRSVKENSPSTSAWKQDQPLTEPSWLIRNV